MNDQRDQIAQAIAQAIALRAIFAIGPDFERTVDAVMALDAIRPAHRIMADNNHSASEVTRG